MSISGIQRNARRTGSLLLVVFLSGCATVNMDKNLVKTSDSLADFSTAELILKRTKAEKEHAQAIVDSLLDNPLNQPEAVQLALANSPAFQALLARNWATASDAAQSGRIPNPILSLEDFRVGSEKEITQVLSFGLLDILTLPQRQKAAKSRMKIAQIRLTSDVIDHITQVRQAWVRAIAAAQSHAYAVEVYESAEASAELAQRMESVGNFSRLDRARQQSFYTDAATQLSASNHNMLATKEALIRLLGLTDEQLPRLKLPNRLPALPEEPRSADFISRIAMKDRLDIKMAAASLNAASRAQGMGTIFSFTDIELGAIRQTIKDEGEKESGDGYELDIQLPLFDWGGAQRAGMDARTLAAANEVEATLRSAVSGLRESYSAYRTAYDVASFYQDEVLPLQEIIAEENVLRYNGMLIGVFELLADSRRQITTVLSAIDAEEQFWLADAAIQASIIGKPTSIDVASAESGMSAGEAGH